MDYSKMKKDELLEIIKELEPLAEKGKSLVHLPEAVESKDKEISDLQEKLKTVEEGYQIKHDKLIEDLDAKLERTEKELKNKYSLETDQYKAKTEAELKKTREALAESQNRYQDLDALRIKQLEEVLYAYGDFLKISQAAVDSHMKLNEYIVNGLQGGKK